MNSFTVPRNYAERVVTETIQAHWVLFLLQGIIMIGLGAAAIAWPLLSTLAFSLYVGWMFLFSGVLGLVTMVMAPNAPTFFWSLLTAALSLFVGVLLLWHPVDGVVSLTLVLIAFFIVEGVFQIAAGFRDRRTFPVSWGWLVLSGLADLLLAAIMISGWPLTAAWALGLIVGVNLLTSGLAITMVVVAARSMVRDVPAMR